MYVHSCALIVDAVQVSPLHRAIRGHYIGEHPWYPIEDEVIPESARIVGAKSIEVTIMNTLTVNMHLGMVNLIFQTYIQIGEF